MLRKSLGKYKDHQESIAQSETLVGLITTLVYVRIGTILDIVPLEIVVYICTIGRITRRDGSRREIFKERKKKDGGESATPKWQLNKIYNKLSNAYKNIRRMTYVKSARNSSNTQYKSSAIICSALHALLR